jgi:hypothetical protein
LVSVGVFFFDLFCGGIVSCFSAETRWAPMLGSTRRLEWDPRTREYKNTKCTNVQVWNTIHEKGDKESPQVRSRLKSCESFYMCPRAPFYRETKGLLHSENTLESMEYSQCEHIHKCLLHPVICGLISYLYRPATSSHAKPGLFR